MKKSVLPGIGTFTSGIHRVAIYARVSTPGDRQDVENQLRALRAFAKRYRWKVVQEFVDKASGAEKPRPEFERMMEAASQRHFDVVIFWALDRFSREDILTTLQYLQRLRAHGVEWISYSEEYLRSVGPISDMAVAMIAFFANWERIRNRERIKAGLETARARGVQLGRRAKIPAGDVQQMATRYWEIGHPVTWIQTEFPAYSTATIWRAVQTLRPEWAKPHMDSYDRSRAFAIWQASHRKKTAGA